MISIICFCLALICSMCCFFVQRKNSIAFIFPSFFFFPNLGFLVPFLEGRRSPDGLDAQQRAEIQSKEIFSRASCAIGMIVGVSQEIDFLLKQRTKEITSALAHSIPELDDRCQKNYAILICYAEKVKSH